MTSMVLGDSILESLTPSVNARQVSNQSQYLVLTLCNLADDQGDGGDICEVALV
jgi:hypothetical protein